MSNGIGSGENRVNLYNSRALLFQLNPETRTSWLPKGDKPIDVSFVASIGSEQDVGGAVCGPASAKRKLKIVGTNEHGETVLDAVILPNTNFDKRAPKFGQWIDHTRTLYGLGFDSEPELNEFMATFKQLQQDILTPPLTIPPRSSSSRLSNIEGSNHHLNNSALSSNTPVRSSNLDSNSHTLGRNTNLNSSSHTLGRNSNLNSSSHTLGRNTNLNSSSHTLGRNNNLNSSSHNLGRNSNLNSNLNSSSLTLQNNNSLNSIHANNSNHNISATSEISSKQQPTSSSNGASGPAGAMLHYENEHLKQALEESSKNAQAWHDELLALRTNNVKLTQALMESKANVGEWQRELNTLRLENKQLKMRLESVEYSLEMDNDEVDEYKESCIKYKNLAQDFQSQLQDKSAEVDDLKRELKELRIGGSGLDHHDNSSNADQLESAHQKQELTSINTRLEAKVRELEAIQIELSQLISNGDTTTEQY